MRGPDLGQNDFRLPMLLLSMAVLIFMLTGTLSRIADQNALAAAGDNQARAASEGERMRRQVDALLAGATGLANGGDGAAKTALEAIARQGVNYTPTK